MTTLENVWEGTFMFSNLDLTYINWLKKINKTKLDVAFK